MAKLNFDVSTEEGGPWTEVEGGLRFDAYKVKGGPWKDYGVDPLNDAMNIWEFLEHADKTSMLDFWLACELAPYDGGVREALWNAAVEEDIESLPQEKQAALAVALIRKKPPSGRDVRLFAVAEMLSRDYGLNDQEAEPILAKLLPYKPAAGSIPNLLSRVRRSRKSQK